MITCKCGKTIEKVPDWMQGIDVEFICNNCPNRQTKNIAFATLDPTLPSAAKLDDDDDEEMDVEEVAEEDIEEPVPEA